ncbi:MAG: DUF58 domain-containing protein [Planctomycetota bacterium]|nr:DUF58 domain-containing protein [Planctomycetota bacterium]
MAEDYRKYLDPRTLSKISRLDLIARLVVEGFISGLHRSPYHGFSVEFAEHREYVAGDDIRHMDWKVYGKTDRYYIKEYEEETNLKATILLDVSESMSYKSGPVSKFEYGCFIAASLAHLILRQQDAVGLALFDRKVRKYFPASAQPGHLKVILHELQIAKPGEPSQMEPIFHDMAERIRKKGLIIVISDMFDDLAQASRGLRHLRHRKHEVILFHVLDHDEVTFPFDRMTRFLGMENGPKILANPKVLRDAYLEEFQNFQDSLKRECRGDRIDYVSMDTSRPLDVALATYLAVRSEKRLA